MSERLSTERLNEMVTMRGAMSVATLTELLALADEVQEWRKSDGDAQHSIDIRENRIERLLAVVAGLDAWTSLLVETLRHVKSGQPWAVQVDAVLKMADGL